MKSYFDTHAHSHSYHYPAEIYDKVCELIKLNYGKRGLRFLDVGCGDGGFIKRAISVGIDCQFVGTDLSFEMIKTAQENLKGINTDLIVCDGFNLPIRSANKFDCIHLDSVLHHLIRQTKSKSLDLVSKLLYILKQKLSDNGVLIIQEVYYDSYLIPSLTSALIFYALKFFNFINFDASSIIKEVQLGLEVNFMHTDQIKNQLEKLQGNVEMVNKVQWVMRPFYRLLFLKDHGHITFAYKIEC